MTRGPQSSVVALRKCIYMTRGPQSDVVALWKQVTRGPQSCVVALTKQMTRGPQSGVVALRKEGIVLECPYPTMPPKSLSHQRLKCLLLDTITIVEMIVL